MWRMKKVINLDRNACKYYKTEVPKFTLDMELELKGKVIVITGASSGIGLALTEILFERNATIIMIIRNVEKAMKCTKYIRKKYPTSEGKLFIFKCDLSSYGNTIRVVFQILKGCKKIDLLINNAGIGALRERKVIGKEGSELVMASNYFGHFLLTINLLPLLRKSKGKVISITSFAFKMYELDEDFCQREEKYNGWKAYSNSKACQIIMTKKLSQIIPSSECSFIAVSPGIVNTPISETFSNNLMGKSLNFLLAPIKNFVCRKFLLTPEKACEQIISLAFLASEKIFHGAYVSQNRLIETNFNTKLENKIWLGTFHELSMNKEIETKRILRGPMANEESLVFIKKHPEIYLAYLKLEDLNLWERNVILPNEEELYIWLCEKVAEIYNIPINDRYNDYIGGDLGLTPIDAIFDSDNVKRQDILRSNVYSDECERLINNDYSLFEEGRLNIFVYENFIEINKFKDKDDESYSMETTSDIVIKLNGKHDTLSKNKNTSIGLKDDEIKTNIQSSNIKLNSNIYTTLTEFDLKNDVETDESREENKCGNFILNGSNDSNNKTVFNNKDITSEKFLKKKDSFIRRLLRTKKEIRKEDDVLCDENVGYDVVKSADDYMCDIIPNCDEQILWSQSINENRDVISLDSSSNFSYTISNNENSFKKKLLKENGIKNSDNAKSIADNNKLDKKERGRSLFNNGKKNSSSLKTAREKLKRYDSSQFFSNKQPNLNINLGDKKKSRTYSGQYIYGVYTEDCFDKYFLINYKNKVFDFIESAIETITLEDIADFVNMEKILRKNGFKYNFSSLNESNDYADRKSGNIPLMVFKNCYGIKEIANNLNEKLNYIDITDSNCFDGTKTRSTSALKQELIVFLNSDDEEGLNFGPCDPIPPIGVEYEYENSSSGSCYVTKAELEDAMYKVKYDMKLLLTYKVISRVSLDKNLHSDEYTFNNNTNDDDNHQHVNTNSQNENGKIISYNDGKCKNGDSFSNEYEDIDKKDCINSKREDTEALIKKRNIKNENKAEDFEVKKYIFTKDIKDNEKRRKKRISFKDNILRKSKFIAALYNFDKKNDDIGEEMY
uniref:Dehydrogenase/reductase SDR family member 12 (inferred by orthology to a human protein) n=1 Tax=Strongyloides venezuelensis TaxID=75913 RepID=A0A0K0G4P5_STRVS